MTTAHDICPICGEGHLEHRVGKNTVEYKGQSAELDMHYSICDSCGSEQADAENLRTNKRANIAFQKRVDGLLTGAEVRKLRRRLGLTQAQAARIFGGGPVAFSKYETDDVAQSESMDKLLRLADDLPGALPYLIRESVDHPDASWEATALEMDWSELEHQSTRRGIRLQVIEITRPSDEDGWRKTG